MAVLRLPNKTQIQFIFLQGNKFFYFLLNKKKKGFRYGFIDLKPCDDNG